MKLGILTRRAGYNHGSSLQAYAMWFFLSNAGYDCKVIKYDEYSGHPLWRLRPFVEDLQWFVCKRLPLCLHPKKYAYLKSRSNQYKRFQQFEREYIPLTIKEGMCSRDLEKISRDFDALVCGSDQIWSPLLFDPVYFFNFLKEKNHIPTVAYAPSIGTSDETLIDTEERELMKGVDYVSCREQQGAKIISNIIGKEVPVVLDPTLMVPSKEWIRVAECTEIKESEPYILCYFLGKNIPQSHIDMLRNKTGCKVINIMMFNRQNCLKSDKEITDLGPKEFLGLIKNADWVCTDSFHATIFSYVFKRKFALFQRFKGTEKEDQNSRIYTLLDVLKLRHALVTDSNLPEWGDDFDYSSCEESLNVWRNKSMNFITNSLKQAE